MYKQTIRISFQFDNCNFCLRKPPKNKVKNDKTYKIKYYIYICVCVCVCERETSFFPSKNIYMGQILFKVKYKRHGTNIYQRYIKSVGDKYL